MTSREELVKKISAAMSDGNDSGGYDTLFDMLAHIALKVIDDDRHAQQAPWQPIETAPKDRVIVARNGNGDRFHVWWQDGAFKGFPIPEGIFCVPFLVEWTPALTSTSSAAQGAPATGSLLEEAWNRYPQTGGTHRQAFIEGAQWAAVTSTHRGETE